MTNDMPGWSVWVADEWVRPLAGETYAVGARVRVTGGVHRGLIGIVRAVDGGSNVVHIRTGDPEAWKAWDAETQRMLAERLANQAGGNA